MTQDMVGDVLTGKDKATISLLNEIVKLLYTKLASDFNGNKRPSAERIFNYASLTMSASPTFQNILKFSHFNRLIYLLGT